MPMSLPLLIRGRIRPTARLRRSLLLRRVLRQRSLSHPSEENEMKRCHQHVLGKKTCKREGRLGMAVQRYWGHVFCSSACVQASLADFEARKRREGFERWLFEESGAK